ncbi:MAG: hypothetical protein J7456_02140 [Chloroflexus sp.]|jgi:hypothetical protein|uniref:hypothetical protein n=1 Tax=unclassified Chloroflexus TaxID=2633855 RepID=UPI00068B2511|nr:MULTISPECIES: hypothetical protein [unclassified Chloroflexus]MBO9312368.1 hypothetical protein [Chloroflexus sp.]MBO9314569.1 hypothetical protein [Chloroflexus sp.]MBO9318219.1 hypothetical protein [Chloroflexus sp.]MBO9337342.1 hypothetical protein [Chloroflexus sp.]MBO9346883.1 hypothetical protein [Chloroflexus sp.]
MRAVNDNATINTVTEADHLTVQLPLQVIGLSSVYAATLSLLQRRFPTVLPDHLWAEVAGGVVLSLAPVALAARRLGHLDWRRYEELVWRSFVAAGIPIILWQLGENILRQQATEEYLRRPRRSAIDYADDTTPLANRTGDREGRVDPHSGRGGSAHPAGPEYAG